MDEKTDLESVLSIVPSDDENNYVPLTTRHTIILLGASNVMVQWTSHLSKCLLSGLAAAAAFIIILIVFTTPVLTNTVEMKRQQSIFFVDATEKVSLKRACVAEFVARLYSDVPSYFYICSKVTPSLKMLTQVYPNFYVRIFNWMANIRETPMESWRENQDLLRLHLFNSSADVLEMTARALILWKYGGWSVSLDGITAEKCAKFDGMNGSDLDFVDTCEAGFYRLQPCHVFTEKLILEIMERVKAGEHYNAGELVKKALQQVCPVENGRGKKTRNCSGMRVFYGCSKYFVKDWDMKTIDYCPRVKEFTNYKVENINFNKTTLIS